ncbi:MAG TPA: hypothetical protein VIW64_06550 [Pyrinomonadaceae bacterium]
MSGLCLEKLAASFAARGVVNPRWRRKESLDFTEGGAGASINLL